MVINTNLRGLTAYRDTKIENAKVQEAQERLASGVKVNDAADDAAGIAIGSKMMSQVRGLDRAEMNIGEGLDLLNVADGAAATIGDMVHRIRELAIYASNDTLTDDDRKNVQVEVASVVAGADLNAQGINYNTIPVASPSTVPLKIQIGANANQMMDLELQDLRAQTILINNCDVTNIPNAQNTISICDNALDIITTARARYGSYMTRLDHSQNYARIGSMNTADAMSRIMDADMAKEMMNLTKSNVLMQASTAMLMQANEDSSKAAALLQF